MAELSILHRDDGLHLAGDINYQTVSKALKIDLFSPKHTVNGKIRVNFSQIGHVDSSAFALMIHWLRAARKRKIDIHFSNIPERLKALAEMSNLEQVLPLS